MTAGIIPQHPGGQNVDFTKEQFERFKLCLKDMYGVDYKGYKFVPGGEAYFEGYSGNKSNFYKWNPIGNITVRTDQKSYTEADLRRKFDPYGVTGAARVVGYTDRSSPYVNAIASTPSV